MFKLLEPLLRKMAFRRAVRAIDHAQKDSWYLAKLLRTRLEGGLSTPDEVLATLRAQASHFHAERNAAEQ